MKFLFSDAAFGLCLMGSVVCLALGGAGMLILLAVSGVAP